MSLTFMAACFVGVVIICLIVDCITTRRDRRELKRDLDYMTDRYNSAQRRAADLSDDCHTLRDEARKLLIDKAALERKVAEETFLSARYAKLYDAVVNAVMKD